MNKPVTVKALPAERSDPNRKYHPASIAENIVRHGRAGAIQLPTEGIIALAVGFEHLRQQLRDVADVAEQLRDLLEDLVEPDERRTLEEGLDLIDAAVFGGTPTQEATSNE